MWCAQYKDWEMSREDLVVASRRNIVDFLEDAFYVAPITELALLHATAPPPPPPSVVSSTFFYVLNYSTEASIPDMLAYSLGAALTDGIDPFSTDVVYSPADRLLSEIVLNYWSNFIRTGYISIHILGDCNEMRQKVKLTYDTEKILTSSRWRCHRYSLPLSLLDPTLTLTSFCSRLKTSPLFVKQYFPVRIF